MQYLNILYFHVKSLLWFSRICGVRVRVEMSSNRPRGGRDGRGGGDRRGGGGGGGYNRGPPRYNDRYSDR